MILKTSSSRKVTKLDLETIRTSQDDSDFESENLQIADSPTAIQPKKERNQEQMKRAPKTITRQIMVSRHKRNKLNDNNGPWAIINRIATY
nr:SNF2 domain-containing protein / helicase domain-containing protein [Tanacetum cinerariifolium]